MKKSGSKTEPGGTPCSTGTEWECTVRFGVLWVKSLIICGGGGGGGNRIFKLERDQIQPVQANGMGGGGD